MGSNDLLIIAESLWGEQPELIKTKINGIYDVNTSRHGGYLVDISLHPELKEFGEITNNSNIRAFEEDYEALKVLWLFPELINNTKNVEEWLNSKSVVRYDGDDKFIKEFPERRQLKRNEFILYEQLTPNQKKHFNSLLIINSIEVVPEKQLSQMEKERIFDVINEVVMNDNEHISVSYIADEIVRSYDEGKVSLEKLENTESSTLLDYIVTVGDLELLTEDDLDEELE